jgi:hypothetical protein
MAQTGLTGFFQFVSFSLSGRKAEKVYLPKAVGAFSPFIRKGEKLSCQSCLKIRYFLFFGSLFHGIDDLLIAGATAQVPAQTLPDLGSTRVGIIFKQAYG